MKKIFGAFVVFALLIAGTTVLRRQRDNPLVSPAEQQTLRDVPNDNPCSDVDSTLPLSLPAVPECNDDPKSATFDTSCNGFDKAASAKRVVIEGDILRGTKDRIEWRKLTVDPATRHKLLCYMADVNSNIWVRLDDWGPADLCRDKESVVKDYCLHMMTTDQPQLNYDAAWACARVVGDVTEFGNRPPLPVADAASVCDRLAKRRSSESEYFGREDMGLALDTAEGILHCAQHPAASDSKLNGDVHFDPRKWQNLLKTQ
jgi:hypothetical protein